MRISLSKFSISAFMEVFGTPTVRKFCSMKNRRFDGLSLTKEQMEKETVYFSPIAEHL